jgi:two-component system OmpR family sensor kinase
MTTTSWLHRSRENLRGLSGRTPLRVKMITALLALVAVALVAISAVGLIVFRNYQIGQVNSQLTSSFDSYYNSLSTHPQRINPSNGVQWIYPSTAIAILVPGGSIRSATATTGGTLAQGFSLPDVTASTAWLKANENRPVTVPAISGGDSWQVVAAPISIPVMTSDFGQITKVPEVLVVGVDLVAIDRTVGQLAKIDALVSIAIIVALALIGVAIVRSSLQPLTDIERTAQAIASGDLSRRVPDRDPRTEVGRLGRSLNAMLSQIESLFQARADSEAAARRSEERMRQFVADASHELRTPLTAMRGYAEYYRQRGGLAGEPAGAGAAAGADAERQAPSSNGIAGQGGRGGAGAGGTGASGAGAGGAGAAGPGGGPGGGQLGRADLDRIMQRVEQESARMGVLVEDMLLLARLDQQRPVERRPVDLLTLAADAVQDARMIAPGRQIELSVGSATAFLVLGDEVRLRQVVGNLMSNALNHTPDGTPITVRLLAGPRHPVPSAVLEVSDQGPGMPPEQAQHVFERFYRGDQARTRKAGGTGLGLAIVAALVQAHGGSVTLQTAPGQGATFRITLPLAPEAQRADSPAEEDDPDLPSPADNR